MFLSTVFLWPHACACSAAVLCTFLTSVIRTPPRAPPPLPPPQNRVESYASHPDQWLLPEDTWKSYDRYRIEFNNKGPDADSLCQKLRESEIDVKKWIKKR